MEKTQKLHVEETKEKDFRVKLLKTTLDERCDKFSVLTLFQLERKYDYSIYVQAL